MITGRFHIFHFNCVCGSLSILCQLLEQLRLPCCACLYCAYIVYLTYHHHRVARPSVSIAVSTNWRHYERSCARIHAVLRPMLWGRRSSSIVRSHVRLGRPARRRQSAGGRLISARRMREWSCDGSALARCPNRRSRLFAILRFTYLAPKNKMNEWINK